MACEGVITTQQLIDMGIDADSSSEYVSSDNPTMVTRLGKTKKTVQGMNDDAQAFLDAAQEQVDNIIYTVGFEPAGLFEIGANVTSSQQVLSYDGEQYRTDGAGTVTQATPELDPLPWYNVTLQDKKTVARSLNALDSQVIYDTDTVTPIPAYIYSASQQKTYSVPAEAVGKNISIVVDNVLTTSDLLSYIMPLSQTVLEMSYNVIRYGAISDDLSSGDIALAALALEFDYLTIPLGFTLRVSDIPTNIKVIAGGGRLKYENSGSIITYAMPAGFKISDVEIETVYRNSIVLASPTMSVSKVTEIQSDVRTDAGRYSCVEWFSAGSITFTEHVTNNTGLRVVAMGKAIINGIVTNVNHIGEGTDGNAHGVDGIKCSGLTGVIISNYQCYGTSRDVIDTFIGGGNCNISDVFADGYYFNQIEIKSEGIAAPDNDVTPHDINISNINIESGGKGAASNFAALFLFNQDEGSVLNSPRRVNVTNWNARLIGTTATGTYHGIYGVGAYDLNLVNTNLLSAKDNGMTLTRCNSIKLTNSNIHGNTRAANFNDVNDIELANSTLGEDLESGSVSSYGAFFSGTCDGVDLVNSHIKGSIRGISGEAATVNNFKAANSNVFGQTRVDIFDGMEFTACTLDGNSSPGAADVFISGTDTPSTKLKIVGGTIKNGRYGVNQQSLNKFTAIGVDFENLTVPMGGAVANNNRRVIGCLSDGAGAFSTPAGDDVIVNNIEI